MEANTQSLSDIAYFITDCKSHAWPFLGHLAHLKSQGISFDVYGAPGFKDVFGKLPQNISEFDELSWLKASLLDLFRIIYEGFLKTIPAVEALWEEKKYKPKLIIADMFASFARTLAQKHGIPIVTVYSTHFFTRFPEPVPEYPTEGDETLISLQKQVEEKYGVIIQPAKETCFEGDKNISCLPQFVGEIFVPPDDNFVYVGPGFRDEDDAQVLALDPEFLKGNDFIYVCLGATISNIEGFTFYESIIEALKDTEHKVLISATMGKAEELIAKGVPKNIIVKSWVPQLKVLEHAKLFISHVGSGSIVEALAKGVPIIAAPIIADQLVNAEVVDALGVGKWLTDKSPENLKKTVEEVLRSDSIKANCKKYKEMIDPKASKEAFVDIIKSFFK